MLLSPFKNSDLYFSLILYLCLQNGDQDGPWCFAVGVPRNRAYGLIGSYEWTQQFAKVLSQRAVAYLNVDVAVGGKEKAI